jgi:Fe-S-cluster-containing hydrogenase component 2
VINPEMACIRIRRDHEKQIENAIYCHQCIDAPCIESCEYEALSRDLETNAIIVDEKNCIACMDCYYACPYSTPKLNLSNEHIVLCDLCGGEPECVATCPEHAIQYLENKINSGEN